MRLKRNRIEVLEFGKRLTVFIGANGSRKTTIRKGITIAIEITTGLKWDRIQRHDKSVRVAHGRSFKIGASYRSQRDMLERHRDSLMNLIANTPESCYF